MPDVIRARISSQDTADDLVHYDIQCMQCEDTWHRKLLCVKDAISVRQRVVQKEFTRLTDNQKDTFRKMTGVICRANENLCSTRPDVCPVWGTVHPMLYRRIRRSDGIAAAAVISLRMFHIQSLSVSKSQEMSFWIRWIWYQSGKM